MRSAIYDILFCNRGNVDTIKYSEEYEEVHKEYNKCYEKLHATLNGEQKEILDELFLLTGGIQSEAQITFYEEGFKMAVKLLTDGLK